MERRTEQAADALGSAGQHARTLALERATQPLTEVIGMIKGLHPRQSILCESEQAETLIVICS